MDRKRNRGMTMVEIVIAFVMLTLVMGILYSCITFASNLMKEAADIDRNNAVFEKNVADRFSSGSAYAGGTADTMTLTFHEVKEDGTQGDKELEFTLHTWMVTVDKTASSGGEVRNVYLYSTDD